MPGIAASRVQSRASDQMRPSGPFAVIGVDVLADERDLAHAGLRQCRDFGDDFLHRTRDFGAARIRHDAEGAELVAAFLHRDESGDAARPHRATAAARGRWSNLSSTGNSVSISRSCLGAAQQIGQTVIVLRPDDKIDGLLPAHDLAALGLRDAAGHHDLGGAPVRAARRPSLPRTLPSSEKTFSAACLADVAGVEDDEIRVVQVLGFVEARRRQQIGHLLRIVSIHLTAI